MTNAPAVKSERMQYLASRGISEATCKAYGFYADGCQSHEWKFDTHGNDGHIATRLRRKPKEGKPKSIWIPGLKAQGEHVFYLPDCWEAMADIVSQVTNDEAVLFRDRSAWVVEGEFDIWTIHSAIALYGERPAPALMHHTGVWLREDVQWLRDVLGIRRLLAVPDMDTAGRKKILELARACDGLDNLHLDVRRWKDKPEKFDLNQLWQDVGFDRQRWIDAVISDTQNLTINDVYRWCEYTPLTMLEFGLVDLPQKIAAHLPIKSFNHKGWSNNFNCIFHEDKTPSAALHQDGNYLCQNPACGSKTRSEMAAHFGLNTDVAKNAPTDKRSLMVAPAHQNGHDPIIPPIDPPAETPDADHWSISLRDAALNYDLGLTAQIKGSKPPVIMPWPFLHQWGGYAHIMPRGSIMQISSDSGMGKSHLVRAGMRQHVQNQQDGMGWFSEHMEADSLVGRRMVSHDVQSMEGISEQRYMQIQIYHSDPLAYPHWKPTQTEIDTTLQQTAEMRRWPGEFRLIMRRPFFAKHLYETVEATMEKMDKQGYDPSILIIDYLQKFVLGKRSDTGLVWAEEVAHIMKAVCETFGLVGVLVSQVTQEGSDAMKELKPFKANWMQYLRNITGNLTLMFAPNTVLPGQSHCTARYQLLKNTGGRPMTEDKPITWQPELLTFDISAKAQQNGFHPRPVQTHAAHSVPQL